MSESAEFFPDPQFLWTKREDLNRRWLIAWSEKDVDGVAAFYHPECTYIDAQNPLGLRGREALRAYLAELFRRTPPMTYRPEALWLIEGGFCGRWRCEIRLPTGTRYLRGFDLVLLEDGLIRHNEVYTHELPA